MAITSLTLQAAEAHPPGIVRVNASKSGNNIITTDSRYMEDLYRGEVDGTTDIPVAYHLNADQVTHVYTKDIVPINLPASDLTPEQLKNNFITFGIAQERISLQGVLRDSELPAVGAEGYETFMTKHRFLNLVRRQWEHVIEDVPNPLAYPRLTIIDPGDYTNPNRVDVDDDLREASITRSGVIGYPKRYRGIINSLTFSQQGGRPDIWNWRMDFTVMKNENFWLRPEPATGMTL